MIEKRVFTKKDLNTVKVKDYGNQYRVRVRIARNTETKEYIYKAFCGSDKTDLEYRAIEFIENQIEHQDEQKVHDELFSTDIENWLYNEKYGTLKARSFDRLEQTYENQIKPHIEGMRTKDIKSSDCKTILQVNLSKGLSYSSLLKIYRLLKEFFAARVADGSISASPMNTVKFYSKEFVITNQANIREERDKAVAKMETGADLTPYEEGLAFSKLRMEDKTDIRFLTDEEIAKIKDVVYNGYYRKRKTKAGKWSQSKPFKLVQAEYFLFILNTGIR